MYKVNTTLLHSASIWIISCHSQMTHRLQMTTCTSSSACWLFSLWDSSKVRHVFVVNEIKYVLLYKKKTCYTVVLYFCQLAIKDIAKESRLWLATAKRYYLTQRWHNKNDKLSLFKYHQFAVQIYIFFIRIIHIVQHRDL